jgi:hypothetical protein
MGLLLKEADTLQKKLIGRRVGVHEKLKVGWGGHYGKIYTVVFNLDMTPAYIELEDGTKAIPLVIEGEKYDWDRHDFLLLKRSRPPRTS